MGEVSSVFGATLGIVVTGYLSSENNGIADTMAIESLRLLVQETIGECSVLEWRFSLECYCLNGVDVVSTWCVSMR